MQHSTNTLGFGMRRGLIISLLVTLFTLVAFVHGEASDKHLNEVYSSIVSMQQHVQHHHTNHELRATHASCLNDVQSLKARHAAQLTTHADIDAQLAVLREDVAAQEDAINNLTNTYNTERELWLKQKAPEEKDINEQIAAIELIKKMANELAQKNNKHTPVVNNIIAILDDILKHLRQRLHDLQESPVLERLNHTIKNAKQRLAHLIAMRSNAETALNNATQLIASLKARINEMSIVCLSINTKLENALATLEKDLAMLERILALLDKLRDDKQAAPTSEQETQHALDYDKIQALITELVDILKKEFLALEDPKPLCDKEKAKLNELIQEKTEKEKATSADLTSLRNQLGTKAQDIAALTAKYAALEGQLKEVTAECEILGQKLSKDKDLLEEIAAIAQIMQLVHDLNTKKEISNETATKMTTLLQRIKDELLALIEAKLKRAQENYAQCKVHRGDLMIQYEAKGKELHNLRAVLEQLQLKIKESEQLLVLIRNDKKSLVDLLNSKSVSCSESQGAYLKQKEENESDVRILDSIVSLLQQQ